MTMRNKVASKSSCMKRTILLVTIFAATVCSAQTVLWDGEEATIGSKGGCWDDGNPTVVSNPAKDAVNGSDKCLMFTMTSNSRVVKIPFRDWIKPDMQGGRYVTNGTVRSYCLEVSTCLLSA